MTPQELVWARKRLGLPPLVTFAEIKERYRLLARQNHPDLGGSAEAMEELNRAYALLRDYIEGYRFRLTADEVEAVSEPLNYEKRFKP
ncbi:MAG: J domain-containing protein [Campylobacterales bacterium]